MRKLVLLSLLCCAVGVSAEDKRYCGDESVWVQTLGAGAAELTDNQAGPSYLIWLDDKARVLVNAGPGSSFRFDEAGANFADLEAVLLNQMQAHFSSEFPALVQGSAYAERTTPLKVLGPTGTDSYPSVDQWLERLFGTEGAYPYLASYLTFKSNGGYKLSADAVPATGNRRWARFGSANVRAAAIPVHHGDVPAIAWRVEIGGFALVFAGDFNNQKNQVPKFAKDADLLVVHHSIPETARGDDRELHLLPSQMGRIASQANVRMLLLGARTNRTRGVESNTREKIEENFTGPLIFANDMECWGL